ncbi:unnamed protein product [Dicrocoelium dendriticum]|nr:unnamed protein product [Dicrocoelium dendriticum]
MQSSICAVIFVALTAEFAVLHANTFYTDCSDGNTLISASVPNCSQVSCVADGGSFVNIEITFQAKRIIRSGKAQLCLRDSQSKICLREVADISDICDYMDPGCPLQQGGVYTYKRSFLAPDVSMKGEVSYKLYDEECNVVACLQYNGEIVSKNKNRPQILFTEDSYPCGGK